MILQNKIDLVKESQAKDQYAQILKFVQGKQQKNENGFLQYFVDDLMFDFIILRLGTVAEGAAIIPISAQMKYNVDAVCEYISKKIPVPVRDFTSQPRLIGEKHTVSSPFSDLAGSTIIVVITMGVISFYFNFQLFDLLMSTNLAAKCKT